MQIIDIEVDILDKLIKFIKALIVIVAAVMLGMIIRDYYREYKNAYNEEYEGVYSRQGTEVVVNIPEGAGIKEAANILYKKGLIKYKRAFINRYQESDFSGKLKAGTYTLNTGMDTITMIEIMCPVIDDSNLVKKLVVPEGFTVDMIAARCEEEEICSKEEFLRAVQSVTKTDFEYLNDVPDGAPVRYKLEGYLFPATYDIYKDTTPDQIVGMMLQAFRNYYSEDMRERAEELGYNSFEVLTRASMVEREAKIDSERATIAGVFNNRLNEDMLLQVDPTALYPLTNGMYDKEEVTYEDIEIDSPYNTYKYEGLPCGPICNPGLACINAVLEPEEHEYLYYHVSDKESGKHVFSETYDEHEDSMNPDGSDDSEDSEGSDEDY
jgi:conserved hypothetical protein, YceG family